MENFYPPTQQDRYEDADNILAQINCGRYDSERRDSEIISDLLLVVERMDARIRELENK
jgi:hypothetical protein